MAASVGMSDRCEEVDGARLDMSATEAPEGAADRSLASAEWRLLVRRPVWAIRAPRHASARVPLRDLAGSRTRRVSILEGDG